MEGESEAPAGQNEAEVVIRGLSDADIRSLHAGQVILDLSAIVKELVENSLDAGATTIEIGLDNYGAKGVDVSDNGRGIDEKDCPNIALKHYTSKIRAFSHLEGVSTFGFRGEALAAMANVARLSVTTRTAADDTGRRLEFSSDGELSESRLMPRPVGTSVSVRDLFHCLPVRQEDFARNIKREYGRLLPLVQGYALICGHAKVSLYNTTPGGRRQLVLASSGKDNLRENAVLLFGAKEAKAMVEVHHECEHFSLNGMVSALNAGLGRRTRDRQFCFINRRPVDLPQICKVVTECFRVSPGNQGRFPAFVLNFTVASDRLDVNVTPDKRTVFLSDQDSLLTVFRSFMDDFYREEQSAPIPIQQNAAAHTAVIPQRFGPPASSQPLSRFLSAPAVLRSPQKKTQETDDVDEPAIVMTKAKSASPAPAQLFKAFEFGSSDAPAALAELLPARRKPTVTVHLENDGANDEEEKEEEDNVRVEQELVPVDDSSSGTPPSPFCDDVEEEEEEEEVVVVVEKDLKRERATPSPSLLDDDNVVEFDLEDVQRRLKRRKKLARNEMDGPDLSQFANGEGVEVEAPTLLATFKKEYFSQLEVIGQFNHGFVIARLGPSDLFIVDQHASNEIFNFENLQRTTMIRSQRLIAPIVIPFSPDEEMEVASNLHVFERNGFLIDFDEEAPPGRKVRLVGRPESKDVLFGEEDVREIAALIQERGGINVRPSRIRNMFASRACRMSVMIGQPLDRDQMKKIVSDLATLSAPWNCPHGRPTFRHLYRITE